MGIGWLLHSNQDVDAYGFYSRNGANGSMPMGIRCLLDEQPGVRSKTIAAILKDWWSFELFSKIIKQNLKFNKY